MATNKALFAMMQKVMLRLDGIEANYQQTRPNKKPPKRRSTTVVHTPGSTTEEETPVKRTRSGGTPEVTKLRGQVMDRIFRLIDAAWLAPRYGSPLYLQCTVNGKPVDDYSLNRELFVTFATAILRENKITITSKHLKTLKETIRKRRWYHLRKWRKPKNPKPNWKSQHAALKYGGVLGVESKELSDFMAEAKKPTNDKGKAEAAEQSEAEAEAAEQSQAEAEAAEQSEAQAEADVEPLNLSETDSTGSIHVKKLFSGSETDNSDQPVLCKTCGILMPNATPAIASFAQCIACVENAYNDGESTGSGITGASTQVTPKSPRKSNKRTGKKSASTQPTRKSPRKQNKASGEKSASTQPTRKRPRKPKKGSGTKNPSAKKK